MSVRNLKTKSKTDWARVDQMKDEDIDTSDSPPLDAAYFKRAMKFLPRIRVDRFDLLEAEKYAGHILKMKYRKKGLEYDAFNTALIVSYCRPFSTRYDLEEKRETQLDQEIRSVLTEEEEIKLHARIKKLRDESYAHSDARSHLVKGQDYFKENFWMKTEVNLQLSEVDLLKKMIGKWIKYLDNQISLTKPGGFLIAPASES